MTVLGAGRAPVEPSLQSVNPSSVEAIATMPASHEAAKQILRSANRPRALGPVPLHACGYLVEHVRIVDSLTVVLTLDVLTLPLVCLDLDKARVNAVIEYPLDGRCVPPLGFAGRGATHCVEPLGDGTDALAGQISLGHPVDDLGLAIDTDDPSALAPNLLVCLSPPAERDSNGVAVLLTLLKSIAHPFPELLGLKGPHRGSHVELKAAAGRV